MRKAITYIAATVVLAELFLLIGMISMKNDIQETRAYQNKFFHKE